MAPWMMTGLVNDMRLDAFSTTLGRDEIQVIRPTLHHEVTKKHEGHGDQERISWSSCLRETPALVESSGAPKRRSHPPVDDPARDRARADGGRHDRRSRHAVRRDDADDPPRPAGARGSGLSDLRRPRRGRWTDAVGDQRPGVQGSRRRPDARRAVRALFQPHAARVARRHAVRDDVETRVREARLGADAAHAAVPRSAAARDLHQSAAATAAGGGRSRQAGNRLSARALEATLHQRQATIITTRDRATARRPTSCIPYRLAYAQGGLYLLAYVPEYREVRTFAIERIQDISLLEERFIHADLIGTARRRVSAFARCPLRAARTRRARLPAGRRRLRPRAALASVAARRATRRRRRRMTLDVCLDRALRAGF